MMRNIPYGKQHITSEDVEAVNKVLLSDFLTQGPTINKLEEAFAQYVGAQYAVAVANGTAALHLCALALNVKAGDKVITTPITFAASANCVRYAGGDVVFADIDPATYTIDIAKVRALLEASPKGTYTGIIPVDFSGYPVNLEAFRQLADEHGLWIIEDACHAPGGYFMDSKGKKQMCGNGAFADLAIFSFHPVKHIAAGEGGMITTNSKALYDKLLLLRTHGITKNPDLLEENHGGWYYEMQELGYNYRLTDFQAALALSQLSRADAGLKRRETIAKKYDEAFARLGIIKQQREAKHHNAYHLYVIEVDRRKELYDYLREAGIFSQVHYIPVHTMPYYKKLGWKKGDFPLAEKYYERCLSIPMYPSLTDEEQDYVIEKIKSFFER
ncbi:UDP-4-amino-4, 6-dideoxy-N-acetyl-beta-L-altrosamine transaminase [Chryseotalea sanaruensis]|uniref:UDP-4-amino-4, 6-dideoxy-N-acetyl-beta-L-altrosamine transaminase n=1 Tax=Chryseotalea sanaruensis TaxID=2482724 RepID=A0A401U6V2_9BACT|nr:UDP-4-amino-4,6-dideoxy-N-acetyl-beta-L-altrosamine transaminase [Chryseotalea sanaruensis]GCC50615.1 UDP-4-amino-4, 6-dideoxy-N-acetyl-beta-L-altrosamine transaminase [Chryseotalea sanaruensis]